MAGWLPLSAILLIAFVALCCPSHHAMADDASATTGIRITSQDGTTHTYEAHKLLSGTFENGVLKDPSLEGCVPKSAFVASGATEQQASSAQSIAQWLGEKASNDSDGKFAVSLASAVLQVEKDEGLNPSATFASGAVAQLTSGYWLITSDGVQPIFAPVTEGEVLDVQEKATTPTPTKFVGGSDARSTQTWKDAESAGIGDRVSYQLRTTLPSNLKSFSKYELWLCDSIDDGLEYDGKSVSSRMVHDDGTSNVIDLNAIVDGNRMRVGTDDLLRDVPSIQPTDIIVVEYDCVVSTGATCGLNGANKNSLSLQYSKSPLSSELAKSSVSSIADIYSFQIDLSVLDKDDKGLPEACFVVQNVDGAYRAADNTWSASKADAQVVATNDSGIVSFSILGEGTYTFTETTAPAGHDLIKEPVVVNLTVSDAASSSSSIQASSEASSSGRTVMVAARANASNRAMSVAAVSGNRASRSMAGNGTSIRLIRATSDESATDSISERTLSASAVGSEARVISVDAGVGVVTVQIKEPDSNNGGSGSNGGGSGGANDTNSGGSNGAASSPVSVISRTLRSALPATADSLLMLSGGTFVVAIGLIALGKRRRSMRGEKNGED